MPLPRRFIRFSVASLLILMCMIAGYYGGQHRGYNDARRDYLETSVYLVDNSQRQITQYYDVDDLVTPFDDRTAPPNFESLVDLIESTVAPDLWGEPDSLAIIERSKTLKITQTGGVHLEIVELLNQLRSLLRDYRDRIAAGKCGHCGNGAPGAGENCVKCGMLRAS
jgi:hypothetical protein